MIEIKFINYKCFHMRFRAKRQQFTRFQGLLLEESGLDCHTCAIFGRQRLGIVLGQRVAPSVSKQLMNTLGTSLGGVPREQKMLKGHLPRVIYHQVYYYTKINVLSIQRVETQPRFRSLPRQIPSVTKRACVLLVGYSR